MVKKRNMVEIEIYENVECSESLAETTEPPLVEQKLIVNSEKSARKFEFTIMYFGLFFCGMITGIMLLLLESDQRLSTEDCRLALQNFESFESIKHKCYFEQ